LAHWLAGRTIFGPGDKIVEDLVEHWCIAKLMRLVGPIPLPEPSKTEIVDEFALAEYFEKESFVHLRLELKRSSSKLERFARN
jgi:hypothetical protein